MRHNKSIEKLCVLAITGQITSGQRKKLEQWLKASAENRLFFNEMTDAWRQMEKPENVFKPDLDKEWHRFENDFITTKVMPGEVPPLLDFISEFFKRKYKPVLITAMTAFLMIILIWQKDRWISPYRIVETRKAETLNIRFSDGSHATLNTDSRIKFPKTFSKAAREVIILKGEVFFQIKRDGRPFGILTKNARINVLGTQFNVRQRNNLISVIVKTGSVELVSLTRGTCVEISKGKMSRIGDKTDPEEPIPVDAEYLLGWLKGRLVFNGEPLAEAVAEIERHYNVQLKLDDTLKSRSLSGQFETESIDLVLKKICLAFGAEYYFKSGYYFIKSQN